MIRKPLYCILILALALMTVFPIRGISSQPKPILIGATVSHEGKYQEPSWMIEKGYRLWEKQINERGGLLGRPVKLLLYDDKSDPGQARTHYQRLALEEKVDMVLAPYGTPLTLATSEVSEEQGLVMLACGASSDKIFQRGFHSVFGMYAQAERYFVGFLDLAARHGLKTVAVLRDNTPFQIEAAQGVQHWAPRFGLKLALTKGYEDSKAELHGLIEETARANPDALIVCAYPEDGHDILQRMRNSSYRPRALGVTIAPVHPDFCKRAGEMCEKVFGPSQWEPDERIPFPGTTQFVTDFKRFAGTLPTYHAGSAYAACQVLERGILHNQSLDQDKLRNYILALDTVTVIGRFKVDHTGKQIGHNPITIQWQKGKKEIVYPVKMQTAQPVF